MNKLYDAIDPVVIDDDLLRRAIEDPDSKSDNSNKKNLHAVDFLEVEVLKLSFAKIRRIDNLTGFEKLTKLCLDNNDIEKIENLDLSFNKIKKIEGLNSLTQLVDLSLHTNQITTLENMETLTNLTALTIGNNKISNIENISYLRKFKNLSVVSLQGNPICSQPEYKPYVMSRIKNLKYLDYKLVDETTLKLVRDQYQEELAVLLAKEKEQEEVEEKLREKETRMKILKEANLQDYEDLFDTIIKEDNEIPKLRNLGILGDNFQEYKERFTEVCQAFITQMLENHNIRNKEKEQFYLARKKVHDKNDDTCYEKLNQFQKKKKKVLRELKELYPTLNPHQIKEYVAELEYDLKKLYDDLMESEMQLVEQFEEFIREFEAKMSELTGHNVEVIHTHFSKLRDIEQAFHDRILTLGMQEMAKFSKNEIDRELTDEAKTLLSDKELLTNIINTCHDSQSIQIEGKEDDITKYESRLLEQTINTTKENEHQRNSNRVSEVYAAYKMHEASIKAATEGNFDI